MDDQERAALRAQWYALHGAGYAVAAIYLGLDMLLVRLGGQGGSAVECLMSGTPPITLRDFAVRIIPSLVASEMTEAYFTGHHGPEGWSMADDMAEADGLLEDMRARFEPRGHPWDLGAFMDAQFAFAEDLLAHTEPAAAAVALALLREGQLDGDALVALVAAAMGGTIARASAGVPMPRRPRRASRRGNVAHLGYGPRAPGAHARRRRRGGPPTSNPDSR